MIFRVNDVNSEISSIVLIEICELCIEVVRTVLLLIVSIPKMNSGGIDRSGKTGGGNFFVSEE